MGFNSAFKGLIEKKLTPRCRGQNIIYIWTVHQNSTPIISGPSIQ